MRFLLVTANFAPRGGSHPTRTVHLTRYLRELGHEVKVLTYEEAQHTLYAARDDSLAGKVPADVEVVRIPPGWVHRLLARAKRGGHEAGSIKKRTTGSPLSAFMFPDPHFSARRGFVRSGRRILEEWKPDVLITCAYPFTLIEVGAALKKSAPGLVWIADYGDPWNGAPVAELKMPGWRRALDRRLEARLLARADAVTLTTGPTANLYRGLFPEIADRVHVITMGYDPADAEAVEAAPRNPEDDERFVIIHAGRLYAEARDPLPFLRAMDSALASDPDLLQQLKIVLLGDVEPALATEIRRSAAAEIYEMPGWVSVEESIARMKSADGLLLFGNRGSMQIPGKVYQYFGTGLPLFMIYEDESDPTLDVVREYGRAVMVRNSAADIERELNLFRERGGELVSVESACDRFAWPELAAELVRIAVLARKALGDEGDVIPQ